MVTVSRMSLIHAYPPNFFKDSPQKTLPANIGETLKKYFEYYTRDSSHIHVHYNSVAVMVQVDNTVDWDKQQHEQFCEYFNMVLMQVNKSETFEARRYKVEMSYLYVVAFELDKYNDFIRVNLADLW